MSSAKRIFALTLVFLALLAQGLAPASAAVMSARSLDPFSNLPICSTDMGGTADDGKAPVQHDKQSCAACLVCSAPAVAPVTDADPLAPPPIQAATTKPLTELAGPRGPPRRTAQARAPPTFA